MVRKAFVASPGHKLITADFDQIEYRILASRAGEQGLIDAIRAGHDLHVYMTSIVYDKPMDQVRPSERAIMKNATFAFLYGAGDAKFARMAGIQIDQARAFREVYARQFPSINAYALRIDREGSSKAVIQTEYLGRPQTVRKRDDSYKLLNYVTQGEAGDVLKKSLVRLSQTDVGPHMRLPVHDEIILEVPSDEVDHALEVIQSVMPENDAFKVPLSVGAVSRQRLGGEVRMIIAVDPGKMTGWARLTPRGGAVSHSFASGEMPLYDVLHFIHETMKQGIGLEIVCEDFVFTKETLKKTRQTHSTEGIGALRFLCEEYDMSFFLQALGAAKGFGTDKKLKRIGWYQPGTPHANDAARHLLLHASGEGLIDLRSFIQ